jgi:hypothetical protein
MLETFFLSIHIYFTDINNVMHNEFKIGFFRLNVRRGLIPISDAIASKIERNSIQLRILTFPQPLSSTSLWTLVSNKLAANEATSM